MNLSIIVNRSSYWLNKKKFISIEELISYDGWIYRIYKLPLKDQKKKVIRPSTPDLLTTMDDAH